MNNIKAPSLNGDKVFEQYPQSIEEFKKFIGSTMSKELLGADIALYDQGLKAILYYNPRALYEFFDGKGLNLIITKGDKGWYHTIDGHLTTFKEDSRIQAEEAGFQLCFETLEKQLSK